MMKKKNDQDKYCQTAKYLLIAQNYSDAAKGIEVYEDELHYKQIREIYEKSNDRKRELYWKKSEYIVKAIKKAKDAGIKVVYDYIEGAIYFEFREGQASFHIKYNWLEPVIDKGFNYNEFLEGSKVMKYLTFTDEYKWSGKKDTREILNNIVDGCNAGENQKLSGGKADRLTIEQIAEKHRVTVEYLTEKLTAGVKVESEHTDNSEIAKEIALDHLSESPDYYVELSKMEDKLKGKGKGKEKTETGITATLPDPKDIHPTYAEFGKELLKEGELSCNKDMDKFTDLLAEKIKESGYYVRSISHSRTGFGNSNYINVVRSKEYEDYEPKKVRVSDHGVTNFKRIFNEIHVACLDKTQTIDEVAANVISQLRYYFDPAKYFIFRKNRSEYYQKLEVGGKAYNPETDEVISTRPKVDHPDQTVYEVKRKAFNDCILVIDKETGSVTTQLKRYGIKGNDLFKKFGSLDEISGEQFYATENIEPVNEPEPAAPGLNKNLIRTVDIRGEQVNIYTVDPNFVRSNYHADWNSGGHIAGWGTGEMNFIPDGEIWIDQTADEKAKEGFIIHEVSEYEDMKYNGLSYIKAHEIANAKEQEYLNTEITNQPAKLIGSETKFYISTPEHAKELGIIAKKPLYIQRLFVEDSCRNQGVGTKLLNDIEQYAKDNGCDIIFGYIASNSGFTKNSTQENEYFDNVTCIKQWLVKRGYAVAVNDGNNDFHKVLNGEITVKEEAMKRNTNMGYKGFAKIGREAEKRMKEMQTKSAEAMEKHDEPGNLSRSEFLDNIHPLDMWVEFQDGRFYRKFEFPKRELDRVRIISDQGVKERMTDRADGGIDVIISVSWIKQADAISKLYMKEFPAENIDKPTVVTQEAVESARSYNELKEQSQTPEKVEVPEIVDERPDTMKKELQYTAELKKVISAIDKAIAKNKTKALYDKWEDQNYHTECSILLAKTVGTDDDFETTIAIYHRHQADEGISTEDYDTRSEITRRLWPLFIEYNSKKKGKQAEEIKEPEKPVAEPEQVEESGEFKDLLSLAKIMLETDPDNTEWADLTNLAELMINA